MGQFYGLISCLGEEKALVYSCRTIYLLRHSLYIKRPPAKLAGLEGAKRHLVKSCYMVRKHHRFAALVKVASFIFDTRFVCHDNTELQPADFCSEFTDPADRKICFFLGRSA